MKVAMNLIYWHQKSNKSQANGEQKREAGAKSSDNADVAEARTRGPTDRPIDQQDQARDSVWFGSVRKLTA